MPADLFHKHGLYGRRAFFMEFVHPVFDDHACSQHSGHDPQRKNDDYACNGFHSFHL
jgi:hypothetical protein